MVGSLEDLKTPKFHSEINWPLVQPSLLKFLFHNVNVFIFALIWQFLQIFYFEIFSFHQCTFQISNQLFTFICTSTFIRELIVYFLKFPFKVQVSFFFIFALIWQFLQIFYFEIFQACNFQLSSVHVPKIQSTFHVYLHLHVY